MPHINTYVGWMVGWLIQLNRVQFIVSNSFVPYIYMNNRGDMCSYYSAHPHLFPTISDPSCTIFYLFKCKRKQLSCSSPFFQHAFYMLGPRIRTQSHISTFQNVNGNAKRLNVLQIVNVRIKQIRKR